MGSDLENLRLNSQKIIDSYIDKSDWRAKENANMSFSFSGLMLHSAGTIMAHYALKKMYPSRIAKAHYDGEIHLHDLSAPIIPYCFLGETLIVTPYGIKKIKDINIDDIVITYNETTKLFEDGKVINTMNRCVHDYIEITFESIYKSDSKKHKNLINVTKEHPFLTNSGWKIAKNLNVGDELLHISNRTYRSIKTEHGMPEGFYRLTPSQLEERSNKLRENGTYDSFSEKMKKNNPMFSKETVERMRQTQIQKIKDYYIKHPEINNSRLYPIEFNYTIKEKIRNMYNRVCVSCGKNEVDNGQKLSVHHIDEDKHNNTIENLIPLCKSCHGKIQYHPIANGWRYTNGLKILKIIVKKLPIDQYVKVYNIEVNPNNTYIANRLIVHNCVGHSLRSVLTDGLVGVGHIESKPAKHFGSVLLQLVNYLGMSQHEFAGANAFSSLDTYLAPFIAYDKLKPKEVKQSLQEFIFNLNTTSRWGGQLNFSNCSLDWIPASDLADQYVVVGGGIKKDKYSDFIDEQESFNNALMDIFIGGDKNNRPFTFPIPTINLTKDFPWKSDLSFKLFEVTAKYGLPYFDNYINALKPGSARAMCCHLRIPLDELREKGGGGLFGAGENCGSVGVVSINLNRIGYLAKDESDFFRILDIELGYAKDSLEIKRKSILESIAIGLLPLVNHYIVNMDHFFSVIGIVGMHDGLLNFIGRGINEEDGRQFAIKAMNHIRKRLVEFQEETGNLFALEATPAEGSSYRLARLDRKLYPDIRIQNMELGGDEPYLVNSTQLPVGFTDDPFEALELQEELQSLYNSGTCFHIFIGETESVQPEIVQKVIKTVATKYKIPTFTWTPTFSICPNCGLLHGEVYKCPKCNSKTEVYSRVVGYLRPVSQWNKGKQAEFKDRKLFHI